MDPVEQQYMDALFSRFDDSVTAASAADSCFSQGPSSPWRPCDEPGNEPAWTLNDSIPADYMTNFLLGLGVGASGGVGDLGASTPSWPASPGGTSGVTSMLWSSDSDSPTCVKENVGKVQDVPPIDLLSEHWNPEDAGVPSALQRQLENSIAWAFKNKRE